MRVVDANTLLGVWDAGHAQRPERWALTALASADPESNVDALARLSIGQRDAALLAWRSEVFGDQLNIVEQCPRCREQLEVDLVTTDLLVQKPAALAATDDNDFSLHVDGCTIRFRLPNSLDLIVAAGCADVTAAEALLIDRCVIEAQRGEEKVAGAALPPAVVVAVSERMTELDPQAELRLNLRCAACAHGWTVTFDILPFLWCELNAWALRVLHEVHQLAAAYGWTENTILTMSAARRRCYLAMLGA